METGCLSNKHIVMGITGGIAAYKAVFLLRLLKKAGAEVQVILTPAASEFIPPLTLSTLSENPVIKDFFTANTGEWHSHVKLGLWADLMIISPATANTIAKMANGIADNMLLTTYLSMKADVMIAPAMDLDMWNHKATQRNLRQVVSDGVRVVEPSKGFLASGLTGKGRMAEPEEIYKQILNYFNGRESLRGKKFIVTAGPTFEKIDPVRFIGNHSSGKMGFAIAEEAAGRGADVVLISGPTSLECHNEKIKRIDVVTADEMYENCLREYDNADVAIFAAAVADFKPEETSDHKIKKSDDSNLTLTLVQNPDIAESLGKIKKNQINIGFALETNNEKENAVSKLKKKNFDFIVLNSLNDPEAGFNKDTNKIKIITSNREIKDYPAKSKKEVASDIIDFITGSL